MKLASLKNGRDGKLVVVSKDLTRYTDAGRVAPTLQAALDDWENIKPGLEELAQGVETGSVPTERFHERECASPLPRAYQWADGSAYINHVELVRKARGAEVPESFYEDPLMYQGGSDSFLGPRDDIAMPTDDGWGIDMEGEIAVITGDVPMGVTAEEAGDYIRLIMLVNDVSLRGLIPAELAKGFGFFQSKPSSAFTPCAVTPDELGDAWDGGALHRVGRGAEVAHRRRERAGVDAGPDVHADKNQYGARKSQRRGNASATLACWGRYNRKGLPRQYGGVQRKVGSALPWPFQ